MDPQLREELKRGGRLAESVFNQVVVTTLLINIFMAIKMVL
jgi:hypothetical protein